MNSQLNHAVAQSRQQDLLRGSEQRRLARDLGGRPSSAARFMNSIPPLRFARRRSAQVQHTAPAAIDA